MSWNAAHIAIKPTRVSEEMDLSSSQPSQSETVPSQAETVPSQAETVLSQAETVLSQGQQGAARYRYRRMTSLLEYFSALLRFGW